MIYKDDPDLIQGFLEDTSNIKTGHTPGVYFPETIEDVSKLLRESVSSGKKFVVAGNGTGTTGGRIPFGDYVIAMEKLNRIEDPVSCDGNEAVMTVGAGALLEDIQKKAESFGWLYPPDPTEKLCFIGSTIANNSSGARTYKYGPTRNHIARITVVLASGDILDIPRGKYSTGKDDTFRLDLPSAGTMEFKVPGYHLPLTSKHNAGYYSARSMDLIDLFIGSEGTLGVIVEADLLLIPIPEKIISCLVYFNTLDDLFLFVDNAKRKNKEVDPRALEFFDRNSLDFLRKVYPEIPVNTAGAVFFEQETGQEKEEETLEAWFELMESFNAMTDESWIALDVDEQRAMKTFRHELPVQVNEWLSKQTESKISTDMAVPDASFIELFNFYRHTCEKHGFRYIIFGHIGNAHVHLNILPANHDEFITAKALYQGFVEKALELGGTLSAEHGIGKLKAGYLVKMFGDKGIQEMVRIKKIFDPHLVLNMGNLIPEHYYQT
ncbi:FAD-binding oxidoreductase [Prosthecochloris sp.]|uniref:FAD-binding oxidoreductase n=1 Tax=Prosthecochloris sp. TaxID=290513 RepID=UPI00257956DB|nr:FAD-binding oxidoreductase [Prosthecochloris sp.]